MQTLGIDGFNNHKFVAARSHAAAFGPGQDPFCQAAQRYVFSTPFPCTPSHLRVCLCCRSVNITVQNVRRVLKFLDDPRFLQQVAYGTKGLDMGEDGVVEIPAVLRKMLPEKLWQEYVATFSEQDSDGNVMPGTYTGEMCKTDYLRILKESTGKQQKNHVALDDKSERYGHEMFELLKVVVDRLTAFAPALTDAGVRVKELAAECHLHLKADYRDHIVSGNIRSPFPTPPRPCQNARTRIRKRHTPAQFKTRAPSILTTPQPTTCSLHTLQPQKLESIVSGTAARNPTTITVARRPARDMTNTVRNVTSQSGCLRSCSYCTNQPKHTLPTARNDWI